MMCERHRRFHYGDSGQCYPFRVEFRGELGVKYHSIIY